MRRVGGYLTGYRQVGKKCRTEVGVRKKWTRGCGGRCNRCIGRRGSSPLTACAGSHSLIAMCPERLMSSAVPELHGIMLWCFRTPCCVRLLNRYRKISRRTTFRFTSNTVALKSRLITITMPSTCLTLNKSKNQIDVA